MRTKVLPHVGGLNNSLNSLMPFSDTPECIFHTLFLLLPYSFYKHSYALVFSLEKHLNVRWNFWSKIYFHIISILHTRFEGTNWMWKPRINVRQSGIGPQWTSGGVRIRMRPRLRADQPESGTPLSLSEYLFSPHLKERLEVGVEHSPSP